MADKDFRLYAGFAYLFKPSMLKLVRMAAK